MSEIPAFDLLQSPLGVGTTLIEASAGTGKTYCLTGLILRLLLEEQVTGLDRVLAVTFTNAATDELIARLRAGLAAAWSAVEGKTSGDSAIDKLVCRAGSRAAAILRAARASVDDAVVFTIHGFCQRLIAEYAFETGVPFELELLEDERALLEEAIRDFWRARFY
ncbi:MAG: exodeoxyribonuclease V subunit beta, partial [Candidatus Dadabacteria bacterium]